MRPPEISTNKVMALLFLVCDNVKRALKGLGFRA